MTLHTIVSRLRLVFSKLRSLCEFCGVFVPDLAPRLFGYLPHSQFEVFL